MVEPFSKSDKDWSKSLKVFVRDTDDPENIKTQGRYSRLDRTIELSPKTIKHSESDTIGHEIAHHKLGHGGESEYTREYLKTRFRSLDIESEGIEIVLSNLVDHLDEFEVRLYQRGQGYHIAPYENFTAYLQIELVKETDLLQRGVLIQVAIMAISNMQKKGHITAKQAKRYRKIVSSIAKSFKIKGEFRP